MAVAQQQFVVKNRQSQDIYNGSREIYTCGKLLAMFSPVFLNLLSKLIPNWLNVNFGEIYGELIFLYFRHTSFFSALFDLFFGTCPRIFFYFFYFVVLFNPNYVVRNLMMTWWNLWWTNFHLILAFSHFLQFVLFFWGNNEIIVNYLWNLPKLIHCWNCNCWKCNWWNFLWASHNWWNFHW